MDPKKLKVTELREELSRRGLDSNGVKQDLVQRLQKAALDEEEFGISVEPSLLTTTSIPVTKETEFDNSLNADPEEVFEKEENVVAPPPKPPSEVKKVETAATIPTQPSSVATSQPKQNRVLSTTTPAPVTTSVPSPAVDASKPKTEEEKRASRAAKFGIQKNVADVTKEKLAARAERFGLNTSAGPTLEEKKKARAERFGLNESKQSNGATDVDAVKAARAMRFQMGAPGNTETVLTEMQEKKKRRLDRFGGSSA